MAKELMPFGRTRCPKCRNEDPTKLFYSYHVSCPDNNQVCEGQTTEHLHFECRSCNYTGPMQTGDTDTGATPVTAVVTPVAVRRKDKHR